jgi:hypothetical protein
LPVICRLPARQGPRQRFEPEPGIGKQLHSAPLHRVEDVHVEAHQPSLGGQRMRAGGEVLQPRSDGEHDVCLVGKRIGRGRAGTPTGQLQRMIPGESTLPAWFTGTRARPRAGARPG